MIEIRPIIIEDVAEVKLLCHQLGYPISEQQTLQNINALKQGDQNEIFVAVNDDKAIGWIGISYYISLESPPLCEIHGLVVHEQYRASGIGKMLVEKAKQWSRGKGINKLRVRSNIKRTESHLFLQKNWIYRGEATNGL